MLFIEPKDKLPHRRSLPSLEQLPKLSLLVRRHHLAGADVEVLLVVHEEASVTNAVLVTGALTVQNRERT